MSDNQDMPRLVEIEALDADLLRLNQAGYYAVDDTPDQPGAYRIDAKDGAPGWAGWYYWLTVYEYPSQPLKALGWNI